MHDSENEGKEMHGKRNRGQGNQCQGAVATTTTNTREPREGPKVFVPEAKGWWLKVYGPQANRPKAGRQRPMVKEAAG